MGFEFLHKVGTAGNYALPGMRFANRVARVSALLKISDRVGRSAEDPIKKRLTTIESPIPLRDPLIIYTHRRRGDLGTGFIEKYEIGADQNDTRGDNH